MRRQNFILAGAATVLAGCGHHGGLLPSVAGEHTSGVGKDVLPALPLPTLPIVGEVRRFDGASAPAGWAFCDGSTLKIVDNPPLFALLRKTNGGDGVTTFALPNQTREKYVIAVQGDTPKSPAQLTALFNKRSQSRST